MKKALFLTVLLGALLICSLPGYCNDQQINSTIKTFYGAIEKGDINTVFNCLTPETAKQLKAKNYDAYRELGGVTQITEMVGNKQVIVKLSAITCNIVKKDDNSARVISKFHRKAVNPGTKKETEHDTGDAILMKKVNNRWLIDNIEPKS